MKTQVSKRPVVTGMLKSFCLLLVLAACSEEPDVVPAKLQSEPALDASQDQSNARRSRNHPNYNVNVLLLPTQKAGGIGFIKFRQYEDGAQFINLDTWVHGLEPNTNYLLQRAVDTVLDGDCTSSVWLTLGKGLDPQPITTNGKGFGSAQLFRSVAAIPVGSTFDIHFQIIKESTSEVVLSSDCYEYTVR